jgi:hypothetical protein
VSNGTFVKNQFFVDFFGFHGNSSPFLYEIWSLRAVIIKVKFAFFSIVPKVRFFVGMNIKDYIFGKKCQDLFRKKGPKKGPVKRSSHSLIINN